MNWRTINYLLLKEIIIHNINFFLNVKFLLNGDEICNRRHSDNNAITNTNCWYRFIFISLDCFLMLI